VQLKFRALHGLKTSPRAPRIRFFAYHRAADLSRLEAQQAALGALVATASGTIVEKAVDIGPARPSASRDTSDCFRHFKARRSTYWSPT
jgi:hypothetical protein